MTDRAFDDNDLDLPDLGDLDADEVDGVEEDVPVDVRLPADGADPFDDSYADDVPIDVEIQTELDEESALGDASLGIEDGGDDDVHLDEDGESLIDEGRGHAEEGLDFGGDDQLGLDPIPTEGEDDGGLEGLEDPAGERVEADEFPPLDGTDDDDAEDELELGIDLETPPPSEDPEEDLR